jgi:hypothetical protein
MRRRPYLALILALAAAGLLQARAATVAGRDPAQFVGAYVWSVSDSRFGGYSGIEVDADGAGFVAVSDRGGLVRGRLERRDGVISGVGEVAFSPLADRSGKPARYDAEGLAVADDGTLYVSTEGPARVIRFRTPDAPAERLPQPEAFRLMQVNSALEALAIDARGRIYTLPERSGELGRPFPVWRWNGRTWEQPFAIPRTGDFLPTGADFGPDGRLYLLERDFTGILGFRSRVRRFTLDGDAIVAEETLLTSRTGTFDNLEGLSVWQDEGGATRLTMISDDNFRGFQVTEFVEYRLP